MNLKLIDFISQKENAKLLCKLVVAPQKEEVDIRWSYIATEIICIDNPLILSAVVGEDDDNLKNLFSFLYAEGTVNDITAGYFEKVLTGKYCWWFVYLFLFCFACSCFFF